MVLGLTYHISSRYTTNKFLDSKSPVICGSSAGLFAVWDIHMQTASNLATTTSSVDFTIDKTTGEAYISQTKLAELCGVTQQAISIAIQRNASHVVGVNLNEYNQLCAKSAYGVVAHYAMRGNQIVDAFVYTTKNPP